MEYEDFSIKIEPSRGGSFPVIVLRSPAGEARSSFTLPFDPDQLGEVIQGLDQSVRGAQPQIRQVSPGATIGLPQRIGDQLFTALFTGPVLSLLDRSLGMIQVQQYGLRIKIHIDPEEPSLAPLLSLPWELMYRKETREFLNLSRFTPILRDLDVQRPYLPLKLEPPLRILVVISDPSDYPRLDLEREQSQMESTLSRLEGVQVEWLLRATTLDLQERLADIPYHVLHYMGHAGFDEQSGEGVLIMENAQGFAELVDGATLGVLLHDVPALRLVFLNACETARLTKVHGLDPFAGVASALLMAGIPGVVAMQFPISDRAALTFSQRFYSLLSRGYPIDAAVAEGRRAIRVNLPDSLEWATPVLFSSAPQGMIFQVGAQASPAAQVQTAPPAKASEERQQQLKLRYHQGLSAFWLEEWDEAIRCFQEILDLQPDYPEVAARLEESRRKRQQAELREQAQAAESAGDIGRAAAVLETLLSLAPDDPQVAAHLTRVKQQQRLFDLYRQAGELAQSEKWQAAARVFNEIDELQPDYPDLQELRPRLKQELAAIEKREQLDELFERSLQALETSRWEEAIELLTRLQEMEPGYRGADRLLARGKSGLSRQQDEQKRQQAERQRQEQLAALYEQARLLAEKRQWKAAQAKLAEMRGIDPQAADPSGIAGTAQAALEAEEREAQRQTELASTYAGAVRLLRAGSYQSALEEWQKVRQLDPKYPDPQKVESTARARLDALSREPGRETIARRFKPIWLLPLFGALCVFAAIAAGAYFGLVYLPQVQATQTALPKSDLDRDGLSYVDENRMGTDPNNPDSDRDGLIDGEEVNRTRTDPKKPDTDGDTWLDGKEVSVTKTDPLNADTDGDGKPDQNDPDPLRPPESPPAICIPALVFPEEGAVMDNGRFDQSDAEVWDFDWDDCPGASGYHLYVIHTGAEFPVIDEVTAISSYRRVSEGGYVADVNRFGWTWKVRANVDGEWGDWSEVRTFDVEPLDTDLALLPKIEQYVGEWVNIDPETRGMTRLVIAQVDDKTVSFHGYGKCQPTDCVWDDLPTVVTRPASVPFTPPKLSGTYQFTFVTTTITIEPSGEYLLVEVFDDYSEADGRADQTSNYKMRRE